MDVHPTKNVSIGIDPYPNGFSEIVLRQTTPWKSLSATIYVLKKKAKDLKISLSVKALLHMIPVKGSERYHVQATLWDLQVVHLQLWTARGFDTFSPPESTLSTDCSAVDVP